MVNPTMSPPTTKDFYAFVPFGLELFPVGF
jgi:hypothetical protein